MVLTPIAVCDPNYLIADMHLPMNDLVRASAPYTSLGPISHGNLSNGVLPGRKVRKQPWTTAPSGCTITIRWWTVGMMSMIDITARTLRLLEGSSRFSGTHPHGMKLVL